MRVSLTDYQLSPVQPINEITFKLEEITSEVKSKQDTGNAELKITENSKLSRNEEINSEPG
jgi:hypothetical protein